jgi:hypothetical protein
MAAAAAAAAAEAERQAHLARCQVVLSQDPRGSVDNMQTFASCVEFVHPQSGPATVGDKILWGSIGAVILICMIVGVVKMCWENGSDIAAVLAGVFLGALVGVLLSGLIYGAVALTQFLLS